MLVVVSGGPGAGKTTLLAELERCGFCCAAEVARQIIHEQMRDGGAALPWADRELYCRLMLEKSIDTYRKHASSDSVTFFDRGIPDTFCYARMIGSPLEDEIFDVCRRFRYFDRVFIAPPWKEIYTTDGERRQDYDEAVKTYDLMVKAYEDCGYVVLDIPPDSPVRRAEFILRALPAS